MPVIEPRITYIAFQECEIRGNWEDKIDDALNHGVDPEDITTLTFEKDNAEYYIALNDDCQLWLVRPDGLRKALVFKKRATVIIRGSTVKFHQSMVADELSVDEEKQSGTI